MEDQEKQTENYLAILHPELMSRQQLLAEMIQRNVKQSGMKGMDKEELVELFYKTVVPLPQRKYRMNRRGKTMAKHQILMAKRKRTYAEANAISTFKSSEVTSIYSRGQERDTGNSSSRFISSFSLPASTPPVNRLKPPPSAATGERKIIRLKSKPNTTVSPGLSKESKPGMVKVSSSSSVSSTTGGSNRSDLTKIIPAKDPERASSKPIKLKRHSFGATSEMNKDKAAADVVTSTCDIKTSHAMHETTTKFKPSTEKQKTASEEPVEKKFKKISITWP